MKIATKTRTSGGRLTRSASWQASAVYAALMHGAWPLSLAPWGPPAYTPMQDNGEAHVRRMRMATEARSTREARPTAEYARLEERIIARDQKGASDVLYGLMKQERPVTEILRETIRIHAPYTNVPYHQR